MIKLKNEYIKGKYRYGQIVDEKDLEEVFKLRYRIYSLEYGFEPRNSKKQEYDIWDSYSNHFVCVNQNEEIIGTIRNINDVGYGLPIFHINELSIDPILSRTCIYSEMSRFTIDKRYRMSGIAQQLMNTLFKYATRKKIQGILFLTENNIIDSYQRMGFSIVKIGNTAFLHGRDRTPCIVKRWEGIIK
jgi:N-acyl-L-homoserine lactone synthetase